MSFSGKPFSTSLVKRGVLIGPGTVFEQAEVLRTKHIPGEQALIRMSFPLYSFAIERVKLDVCHQNGGLETRSESQFTQV